MTNKELQEKLKEFPDDMEVWIDTGEGPIELDRVKVQESDFLVIPAKVIILD